MISHTLSSKSLLTASLFLALASSNALADSWTVTQGTTATGGTTELKQTSSSSASTQAINSINLNSTNGTVSGTSSQSFNAGDNDLTLQQDLSTASSNQATNRTFANAIDKLTQNIIITPSTSKAVSLKQLASIGNGNTQSINEASISTNNDSVITELSQALSATGIDIKQTQLGGTQNTQAINLIKAGKTSATANNITQTVNIRRAELLQFNSTQNTQVGNGLITLNGLGGGIKQTFTTTSTIDLFKQMGTTSSVQALNYVGKSL